ncbi:MAG: hypothetical protein QNJ41_06035 [Xenococcaceae cyanobacterium MO_188.B32]|nr:hypothetical protein [Xenococcaceae cyanobacterium MO_188.B32]
MAKSKSQDLRFKFYHQLEEIYHQFLDELAEVELTDNEIGKIAQIVMLSRQEGLKRLVSEEEMDAYYERYPQDK